MVIVYEMAILDSFLNSLTNYLFHFAPERILGTKAIEVRQLIAKSRAEVLSECIAKKAAALSKESIVNRIRALEDIFGVKFDIRPEKWKEVKRFVKVRNRIVHEGYAMAFTIGDDMAPRLEPIRRVEEEEMRFDDLELRGVVDIVYRQTVCDVLGRELNELEVTCLDALMMRRARRGEVELRTQPQY